MAITVSWTKSWSNSDNGTILYGVDLQNIQSDIQTAFGTAASLSGVNSWSGNQTFSGTVTASSTATFSGSASFTGSITGKIAVPGLAKNLLVVRDSATQVTATADYIFVTDTSGYSVMISTLSKSAAITSSGAGGLDTGAEANSTWYYIWVIRKSSDGTVNLLLSTSSTAPTMPSGYDQKALISAVRNDGSGNFTDFKQYGLDYNYPSNPTAYSASPSGWASIDITAYVPSALSYKVLGIAASATSNDAQITNDSTVSSTITTNARNKVLVSAITSGTSQFFFELPVLTANTIYVAGSANVNVYILGFRITNLVV